MFDATAIGAIAVIIGTIFLPFVAVGIQLMRSPEPKD